MWGYLDLRLRGIREQQSEIELKMKEEAKSYEGLLAEYELKKEKI